MRCSRLIYHTWHEDYVYESIGSIHPLIFRPHVRVLLSCTGFYHGIIHVIPPEQVTSLEISYWHPYHPELNRHHKNDARDALYNAQFKNYLLAAKNLECFDYDLTRALLFGVRSAPKFPRFEVGENMPAFRTLVLTGYCWIHTRSEVHSSWDFSRLENLGLRGVSIDAFVGNVDVEGFRRLRTLRIGIFVWQASFRPRKHFLLHTCLRKLSQLEEFYVDGYTQDFPLDILIAMENLRILEFIETIAFAGKAAPPRMNLQDLEELLPYLPRLEKLHIELRLGLEM